VICKKILRVKAKGQRGNPNNPLRPDIDETLLHGEGFATWRRYENNDKDCILTIWGSNNTETLLSKDQKTQADLDSFVADKFKDAEVLASHEKSKTGSMSKDGVVKDEA